MKKGVRINFTLAIITVLLIVFANNSGIVNAQWGKYSTNGMKGNYISDTTSDISNEPSHPSLEITEPTLDVMLQFAIEDEYKARAEYEAIINKFGEVRPFTNIIQSEVQHISAIIPLYTKRNMTVPQDDAEQYVVIPETLKEACEIGVQAEIDNIAMYEHFLNQKLPADVKQVFEALKSASYNHLNAFQRCASRY